MHVGALGVHALLVQRIVDAPISTYPALHVNVAVDPWTLALLKIGVFPCVGAISVAHDAVGAALGAAVGICVGAELGTAVVGAVVGTAVGAEVGAALGSSVAMTCPVKGVVGVVSLLVFAMNVTVP
mgnify:CR=1